VPEWETYAAAAERLNTSTEAIRLRARRLRWRTQRSNTGRTLVMVPDDAAVPARPSVQPDGQPPDQPTEHNRTISTLTALFTEQHQEGERLQGDLRTEREARERLQAEVIEAGEARARAEGELTAWRERAERAEAAAEQLRQAEAEWQALGRLKRALRAWRGG
jgi:hypothetical protein